MQPCNPIRLKVNRRAAVNACISRTKKAGWEVGRETTTTLRLLSELFSSSVFSPRYSYIACRHLSLRFNTKMVASMVRQGKDRLWMRAMAQLSAGLWGWSTENAWERGNEVDVPEFHFQLFQARDLCQQLLAFQPEARLKTGQMLHSHNDLEKVHNFCIWMTVRCFRAVRVFERRRMCWKLGNSILQRRVRDLAWCLIEGSWEV